MSTNALEDFKKLLREVDGLLVPINLDPKSRDALLAELARLKEVFGTYRLYGHGEETLLVKVQIATALLQLLAMVDGERLTAQILDAKKKGDVMASSTVKEIRSDSFFLLTYLYTSFASICLRKNFSKEELSTRLSVAAQLTYVKLICPLMMEVFIERELKALQSIINKSLAFPASTERIEDICNYLNLMNNLVCIGYLPHSTRVNSVSNFFSEWAVNKGTALKHLLPGLVAELSTACESEEVNKNLVLWLNSKKSINGKAAKYFWGRVVKKMLDAKKKQFTVAV